MTAPSTNHRLRAAASEGRRSAASTALLLALAFAAGFALLVRIPSVAEPLAIDQGLWASAARGLARGQMLYRDVWDHKPPGIFLAYLAGFSAFGWTPAALAWLDILASALTAALLFAAARRLAGATAAAVSACLYATLTVPTWLYRYGGITERGIAETFIVLLAALAAWCTARLARRFEPATAVVLGLAGGAAVVFKPNAGIYLPALLLWLGLYGRRESRDRGDSSRPAFWRTAALACGGALVIPLGVIAWLWLSGAGADAWVALVRFNRMYAAQGFGLSSFAVGFSKAVWMRIKSDPLWMTGAVASLAAAVEAARFRRLDPLCALAVLWGAAAAAAIAANGSRLYSTYFVQALAPLALLSAWLFVEASRRSTAGRVAAVAAGTLAVLLLARGGYASKVYDGARADLDQLIGRGDRSSYLDRFGGYGNQRGYSARANEELTAYIRDHTGRDDRVYFFGLSASGLYFTSDRLTAHRFLRVNFFVPSEFPDPRFTLGAVAGEIARSRPLYLVFEQAHNGTPLALAINALPAQPPVVRLLASYRLETRIEDFTVYRRVE